MSGRSVEHFLDGRSRFRQEINFWLICSTGSCARTSIHSAHVRCLRERPDAKATWMTDAVRGSSGKVDLQLAVGLRMSLAVLGGPGNVQIGALGHRRRHSSALG